jgi:hypothetical protein
MNDLRDLLYAAIYNKHGGGSVSSQWTVNSILDAIMPIVAAPAVAEMGTLTFEEWDAQDTKSRALLNEKLVPREYAERAWNAALAAQAPKPSTEAKPKRGIVIMENVGPLQMAEGLLDWNLNCCHETCESCRNNLLEIRKLFLAHFVAAPASPGTPCGREFETLCNLPRGHKGMCSWEPPAPASLSTGRLEGHEWRTVIVGLPIIRKLLNGEDISLETFRISLIPDDVLFNAKPATAEQSAGCLCPEGDVHTPGCPIWKLEQPAPTGKMTGARINEIEGEIGSPIQSAPAKEKE